MTSVPEFLRWGLAVGQPASLVLRSGRLITGVLNEVDLTGYVVKIGDWTVRVEEVAGARSGPDLIEERGRGEPTARQGRSGLQPATADVA
jgi:hypothetical protein